MSREIFCNEMPSPQEEGAGQPRVGQRIADPEDPGSAPVAASIPLFDDNRFGDPIVNTAAVAMDKVLKEAESAFQHGSSVA